MSDQLKYMPVFRTRTNEKAVLKSFDFKNSIYPCIEIIKETGSSSKGKLKTKKVPTFDEYYLKLINQISARYVFVDLPVHLRQTKNMKSETLDFLLRVVTNRVNRTDYMKKLQPAREKIIPVVSTFFNINNEPNTLLLQSEDLRPVFNSIAFRTFPDTFKNDIKQILKVIQENDYLIMDWGTEVVELTTNEDHYDIVEVLKKINCTVIVHRNPIPLDLTYTSLDHDEVVRRIDNSLIYNFKECGASVFSDYAGIKRNDISDTQGVSPGFLYYDAVQNKFYGYKGKPHKDVSLKLREFEVTIVPSVISSSATNRMLDNEMGFLDEDNYGWVVLNRINKGYEPGRSAGKFKRIGMEHYLYCIKTLIEGGVIE